MVFLLNHALICSFLAFWLKQLFHIVGLVLGCSQSWKGPPRRQTEAPKTLNQFYLHSRSLVPYKVLCQSRDFLPCKRLSIKAGFRPSKTPWPMNCAIQPITWAVKIIQNAFSSPAMYSESERIYSKINIFSFLTFCKKKMSWIHEETRNKTRNNMQWEIIKNCECIDQ